MKKKTFKVKIEIDQKKVQNLVCCGFEGGVGYWCVIAGYDYGTNDVHRGKVKYPHLELPFLTNGAVLCEVNDEENPQTLRLDMAAIERGMKLFSTDKQWARHFANFLEENDDAETGDVFLQLCMLGDVVYG